MPFPNGTLVEVKFDGTNWTNISDFVDDVRIQRGRSYEFDRPEPGTATITLSDPTGIFSPDQQPRVATTNAVKRPTGRGGYLNTGVNPYSGTNFSAARLSVVGKTGYVPVNPVGTVLNGPSDFFFYRPNTTTGTIVAPVDPIPITAGESLSFAVTMTGYLNSTRNTIISFRDAANAIISTVTIPYGGFTQLQTHGSIIDMRRTLVAPAGSVTATLDALFQYTGESTSGFIAWSNVLFAKGTDVEYFDGDSDGCAWTGAKYTSTSTQATFTSPYYPNIKSGRALRVRRLLSDGTTFTTIFLGYVERWPSTVEPGVSTIAVTAVDSLGLTTTSSLTAPLAGAIDKIGLAYPVLPIIALPCSESFAEVEATNTGTVGAQGNAAIVSSSPVDVATLGANPIFPVADAGGKAFEILSLSQNPGALASGACLRTTLDEDVYAQPGSTISAVYNEGGMTCGFGMEITSLTNRVGATANIANLPIIVYDNSWQVMMWIGVRRDNATNSIIVEAGPRKSADVVNGQFAGDTLNVDKRRVTIDPLIVPYAIGTKLYVQARVASNRGGNGSVSLYVQAYNPVTRVWSSGESIGLLTGGSGYALPVANPVKYVEIGTPVGLVGDRRNGLINASTYRPEYWTPMKVSLAYVHLLPSNRDYENLRRDLVAINARVRAFEQSGATNNLDTGKPSQALTDIAVQYGARLTTIGTETREPNVYRGGWQAGERPLEQLEKVMNSCRGILYSSLTTERMLNYRTAEGIASAVPVRYLDALGSSQPELGLRFDKDYERSASAVSLTGGPGNSVEVTVPTTSTEVVADAEKKFTAETRLPTQAAIRSHAQAIASELSYPLPRCDRITVDLASLLPIIADEISRADIGEKIMVANLPSGAPRRTMTFIIQGIEWDLRGSGRELQQITFEVSPAEHFSDNAQVNTVGFAVGDRLRIVY